MASRSLSRLSQWAPVLLTLVCSSLACSGGTGRDRRPYRFGYGMIDTPDPLQNRARKQASAKQRRRRPAGSADNARRAATVRRARKLVGKVISGKQAAAARRLLRRALGHDSGPIDRLCARARRRTPQPADVVCFQIERDEHVGVVTAASRSSMTFVYLSGERVRRGVLDLRWPHRRRRGNRIVNSYVRSKKPTDRPGTPYLASELLNGYVTVGAPGG
jgi:hypothetical protein